MSNVLLIIGLIVLVLGFQLYLLAIDQGNSVSRPPPFQISGVSHHDRKKFQVAIILQQSPVDSANQISRLKVIDKTWAQWLQGLSHFHLFAAVEIGSFVDEQNLFVNCKYFELVS